MQFKEKFLLRSVNIDRGKLGDVSLYPVSESTLK